MKNIDKSPIFSSIIRISLIVQLSYYRFSLVIYNRFLMGQVNCHCQYIANEQSISFRTKTQQMTFLATQQTQTTQIFTKMTLRNSQKILQIKLSQANKSTFGTTDDSQTRAITAPTNSFKLSLRFSNRAAYIKDCGIGFGVFLCKRKILAKTATDILINKGSKWIALRVNNNGQAKYCIYDTQSAFPGAVKFQEEAEIEVDQHTLLLKRDTEDKQFYLKFSDRKDFWILLSQERRVKIKDNLRLGLQIFEVQGINSYLQASKIVKKY